MRNNENLNMVEAVGMERKGKRNLRKSTHRTVRNWQWNREVECAKGTVQDLSKCSHLDNHGDIGAITETERISGEDVEPVGLKYKRAHRAGSQNGRDSRGRSTVARWSCAGVPFPCGGT